MIRWLVEQKKVRATENHHRQRNPGSLAAGEGIRTTLGLVTGETELRKVTLNLTAFPVWPELAYDIVERSIQRYLRHILAVVAWPDRSTQSQLSG